MRHAVTLTYDADRRETRTQESWADPAGAVDPEPEGIAGLVRSVEVWSSIPFFDLTVRVVRRRPR
jgi:hypothetical protein